MPLTLMPLTFMPATTTATHTPTHQNMRPQRQPETAYGTDGGYTPTPTPRPTGSHTDPATPDAHPNQPTTDPATKTDKHHIPGDYPKTPASKKTAGHLISPRRHPPQGMPLSRPPRDLALAGVRFAAPQAISALTTDCTRSGLVVNSGAVGPFVGRPCGCW